MNTGRDDHSARAMTLLEMLVSMAIVSLMLGAVSSAVVIAGRAVERQSPSSFNDTAPAVVLDLLLDEVSFATAVTDATPTAITFTLPDRTGDLLDETVRYSWSGIVGDPLMRQINADAPIAISGGLVRWALTYESAVSNKAVPGLMDIKTEAALASFDAATNGSQLIDSLTSLSQYVRPSFTSGTVSWTVTSIDLYARQAGSGSPSGKMLIALITPSPDGLPGTEIHSQVAVAERDLGKSYSWVTFSFVDAPALAPGDSICIVISDTAGKVSAEFPLGPEDSSRSFASQGDPATSTWIKLGAQSTPYRIRGTLVTQLPDTIAPDNLLSRLSAEIESTGGHIARGSTSVFNQPEMP